MKDKFTMRKMKLYALGGAGCNIGSNFLKIAGQHTHGFADIECVFVDTSKSNLSSKIPQEQIYLVDGLDGSGKLRSSNFNIINECVNDILHRFKPSDINVVLSSAGGGSGSVLAPVIVSELLSRDEAVIVINVGSTSSRIETENTLKTLKSFEVISQKAQKPVIMAYRENTPETPRFEVDNDIEIMVTILAAIFSGDNRELDMSDLRNFLNYDKVTTYRPKLAGLDFSTKEIAVGKGQALVSLVTLVDEKTSSEVTVPTEYQAVGYVPDITKETLPGGLPIHCAVITGYFNNVVDRLNSRLAQFDETRKVVVEKHIASVADSNNDRGVVL